MERRLISVAFLLNFGLNNRISVAFLPLPHQRILRHAKFRYKQSFIHTKFNIVLPSVQVTSEYSILDYHNEFESFFFRLKIKHLITPTLFFLLFYSLTFFFFFTLFSIYFI